MNALKPTQIYLQCTYYHQSKAQITAMTVVPLISLSQAMVSVSETAAPVSQLKVYRF